jgi:signal transduction histidine kinase
MPPLSLFARLLLVMFGCIAAAQLVSGVILYSDREAQASRGAVFEWTGRIAGMIRLMESIDEKDRHGALTRMHDAGAAERQPPRSVVVSDSAFDTEFTTNFRERLNLMLGPDRDIRIARAQAQTQPDTVLVSLGPNDRNAPPAHAFDVHLKLLDGDLLMVRLLVTPRVRPPYPPNWYVHILILVIVLACGALLMARTVTLPLGELIRAADSLGQGIRHPPLPEKGPRELRRAAHAFNTMQDRLRRYLDGRTRILAAMSHDLKTPITRLRLRAENVTDDVVKQGKFVKDLDEMQMMVQGALDMLQGMDSEEAIQRVDLNALVATLSEDFSEAGLPVEVQGHARAPVPVRPQALRRALSNLLQNAQHYASRASLSLEETPSQVIFQVRDNGPGVPADQLERVFEPFYRLETSRNRATGGTGLGLSIARDIAQAHGGELTLANAVEGGLIATLRLAKSG